MNIDAFSTGLTYSTYSADAAVERMGLLSLDSGELSVRDAQTAKEALFLKYPKLRGKSGDELFEMYQLESAFDADLGNACLRLARLNGSKKAEELFQPNVLQMPKPAAVKRTTALPVTTTFIATTMFPATICFERTSSPELVETPQDLLTKAKEAYKAKDYQTAFNTFFQVPAEDPLIKGEAFFYQFTLIHEGKVEMDNHERAQLYYLRQAANCEFPEAALKLALHYESRGPLEEQHYLEIAYNKGMGAIKIKATYWLAHNAYQRKDFASAKKYYKELADGDSEYRQEAARKYEPMAEDDDEKVKYIFRSTADPDNPSADIYFECAVFYHRSTPHQDSLARHYYKMAAKVSTNVSSDINAKAALRYAEMAHDGIGGAPDNREAKIYYKQAADGGRDVAAEIRGRASHMYAYRLWIEDPKAHAKEIKEYKARAKALRYMPPEHLEIPSPRGLARLFTKA